MKIAYYLDPNISTLATFYTKILLIKELKKLGHHVQLHIPSMPSSKQDLDKNQDQDPYFPFINQITNQRADCQYPIEWSVPLPANYQVLFLSHQHNGKWKNGQDYRIKLAKRFVAKQKRVLVLKDELSMEFLKVLDHPLVIYGNYSGFKLDLPENIRLSNKSRTFIMPAFANLNYPRPNALSQEEFHQHYQLNPDLKLILFFLPKYSMIAHL